MDEQLEQLKIDYKNGFPINIEWLIQQAEKVPELEEVIHLYKLRKENALELNEIVIKPLKEENQQLKETLRFYADPSNYVQSFNSFVDSGNDLSKVMNDGGQKARQELRGESE